MSEPTHMLSEDIARREAFKAFAYFRRVLASREPLDDEMRHALVKFIDATEAHLATMWKLVRPV